MNKKQKKKITKRKAISDALMLEATAKVVEVWNEIMEGLGIKLEFEDQTKCGFQEGKVDGKFN